ncbi:hypothetical protein B0H17DRAFT_1207392 [Mycena rosella]|uniref:Saccharopine dehydrogenase-like C-terminal domain-containing protein n=1 Tax=Mycena rosella TaxID=1033263 RepID=A0AAD7D2W5_MYCRO|nr:hypothetical protein B0H17DRAFT_1207392 [Mycena rosella]
MHGMGYSPTDTHARVERGNPGVHSSRVDMLRFLFPRRPCHSLEQTKTETTFRAARPHVGIVVLNEAGLGPELIASTRSHSIDAFTFDTLPNHGSVPFREFYNISEAEKVFRGRVRNVGFTAFLAALVKLGWLAVKNGQRAALLLDHLKFFKDTT